MTLILPHTCAVVQAGTTTSYNQAVASWTSGITTTAGVKCLIQPQTTTEGPTGAVIGTHVCYMRWADAPASLRAFAAERRHRLTNWSAGGVVRDAGPFDVVQVLDAGGQQHHLELILARVSG